MSKSRRARRRRNQASTSPIVSAVPTGELQVAAGFPEELLEQPEPELPEEEPELPEEEPLPEPEPEVQPVP